MTDEMKGSSLVLRSTYVVTQDIKHWLSWLRSDVGFDGWRFDFVKGYGGQHVREYIAATSPTLVVGEFWDDCVYTDSKLEYDQVGSQLLLAEYRHLLSPSSACEWTLTCMWNTQSLLSCRA